MRRTRTRAGVAVRLAILIAALSFSGCTLLFPEKGPVDGGPVIVTAPPAKSKPPSLPSVAIVLTSGQPAYADVAQELARHFEVYDVYDLSDKSRPPITVLRSINDSDTDTVVAVGLRAAQSSVAMAEAPVVFSQVFNYQDHDLLTATSRGVAALPPLDAQIAAWKKVDPTLTRIGTIIGAGHDDLITEAKLAAQKHGVGLRVQIARSDQETLYYYKRMIRDIDGFWLFPDNRILSGRVLQQMLDDANRRQVPVAVPNTAMLKMGGAISMSTVAADIAETIVKVVRQIQAGHLNRVPPMSQLSEIRVETNDELLKKHILAKSAAQRPDQVTSQ